MQRPPSIVTFERLYLGSWVLGIVGTLLGWPAQKAALARDPRFASNPQMLQFVGLSIPFILVVGTIVVGLLWYFAARRGAVAAKWIIVVFAAFSVISAINVATGLLRGVAAAPLSAVVSLVCTILSVTAAAMLFRPDAKVWFGETPDPLDPAGTFR